MTEGIHHGTLILLFSMFGLLTSAYTYKVEKYQLLIPNVSPDEPDLYLCKPIKLDNATDYYIVGFEAHTRTNTAHHMIVYGCKMPGMKTLLWKCGMTKRSNEGEPHKMPGPCGPEGFEILYVWVKDSEKLELPRDVGFRVGGQTDISYLVLQVHYANVDKFKDGSTDDSGVVLYYTEQPMPKLAAVYVLYTEGRIPPLTTEYMETACRINENKTIHPFAFRTHAHSLGKVISGYKVTTDGEGHNQWTLIGKKDAFTTSFQPVVDKITVTGGDILAARCTMVSNRTRITYMGPRNEDEMCNYFIMYHMDNGEDPLSQNSCFSKGPPVFYWKFSLNNIPNEDASTLEK